MRWNYLNLNIKNKLESLKWLKLLIKYAKKWSKLKFHVQNGHFTKKIRNIWWEIHWSIDWRRCMRYLNKKWTYAFSKWAFIEINKFYIIIKQVTLFDDKLTWNHIWIIIIHIEIWYFELGIYMANPFLRFRK